MERFLLVHGEQKLLVVLGLLYALLHKLHGFNWVHVGKILAQDPHTLNRIFVQQKVVPSR